MEAQILPKIDEETESDLEPQYHIIIHNDNVTPMDFVVKVLTRIFHLGVDRASQVMMTAHIKGSAYVQTLPKPQAEERLQKAHAAARAKRYPLCFTMEAE